MSDLIDRQAAINAIERNAYRHTYIDQIVDIINELPSAQPREGKWIRTRTLMHDGELYCDQCGQEHPEQKKIWNFCPDCGCRMEEGDSE